MAFGRYTGGKHFSKKALTADTKISDAQIKRFQQLGYNSSEVQSLTYDQAAFILKNLKKK